MYNGITFQTVLVAIVIHLASQRIGIYTKIPHRHCLKHKPHGVKVLNQVVRADAKGRCCNGRINEIASVRSTYGCFRPKIRRPRLHILDNENLLQSIYIVVKRVRTKTVASACKDVVSYLCQRHLCPLIA